MSAKPKSKKPPKKPPPPWIHAEPCEIDSFNSWLYGGIDDLLDSREYKQNDHFRQMCVYSKVVIAKASQPMGDGNKRVAGIHPALIELRFIRVLIDSLRKIMKEHHEKEKQEKELSEMYNNFYLKSLLTLVPPKEEEPKDDGTGKKKKVKKLPEKELIPALGANKAVPFKTERPSKFPKLPALYVTLGEIFESFAVEVAAFYEENKPEPPKEGEEDEEEDKPAGPVGPAFSEYPPDYFLKFAKKGQEKKFVGAKLTETASGLFNLAGKEGQEVRVMLFAILSGNKPLKIPKAKEPLTPEAQAIFDKNAAETKAAEKDKKKKKAGGKKGKKAAVSAPEEEGAAMEFVDTLNIGFHRACTDFFHMRLLPALAKELGSTIKEMLIPPKKTPELAMLYPLAAVNSAVDQIAKPWLTDHEKVLLVDEIFEVKYHTEDGVSVPLDWLMLELMTAWIRFYHANEVYMHDEVAQQRDKAMEMSRNMMLSMRQFTTSTSTKKKKKIPPNFFREKMAEERRQRIEQQRKARVDEAEAKDEERRQEERRIQESGQSSAAARKLIEDTKREAEQDIRRKEWTRQQARERRDRSQRLNCDGYGDMVMGFEEFRSMGEVHSSGSSGRPNNRSFNHSRGGLSIGHSDRTSTVPDRHSAPTATAAVATQIANISWAEFLPPGMDDGGYGGGGEEAFFYYGDEGHRGSSADVSMSDEDMKYQAFKAKSRDQDKERGSRKVSMELPMSAVEMARTSSSIVEFVTQRRRAEESRMEHKANWKRYVSTSKHQLRKDARERGYAQQQGGSLPTLPRPEQKLTSLHDSARGCYLKERAANKKAHEEVWPTDDRGM
jgi:hypothetical protein